MQTVYILKGIPASSKSTFAKELMENEPGKWKRINNDSLRLAFDFGIYSKDNEKIIKKTREYLLKEFLLAGYNVIVDNVNASKTHFTEITKVVGSLNLDVEVIEKPFYIDLSTAIERDSKREGIAKVGPAVIGRFYKLLGGDNFVYYVPKVEVFYKREIQKINTNKELPKCLIVDMDSTYAIVGNRSVFDTAKCYLDLPNFPVVDLVNFYSKTHKIIFCTGREDKHREQTIKFIDKHSPGMEYDLLMRNTGDRRSDCIVKEELVRSINDKYYIDFVLDDRARVVSHFREMGLTVFQVDEGNF